MERNNRRVKLGCYMANITMSIVANLSPLLFLTFREMYGISYSLLGTLVLINFVSQLTIDLIFSFFSHKFNIHKTIKIMPFIAILGLFVYAVLPSVFPSLVYLGLCVGTVIFSVSSGLAEVLVSPVIAALPAKDPDREMSKLHSFYAWGVVGFVIVFTLLLSLFGHNNWQWITLLLAIVPLIATVLLSSCTLPEMKTPEKTSGALKQLKNTGIWLPVIAIFLGGSAEVSMAQWSSSYLESALGVPKVWGDIFGVALFGIMLGLGRTLYTKYGKNIGKVLFLGAVGATACYFVAAITNVSILGLLACGLTGLCTSMMWPGSLIAASDRNPNGGVVMFALMAAGGDLGASVGPQLIGVITDVSSKLPFVNNIAQGIGISPEQMGMKIGLFTGMLFPLAGIFVFYAIKRWYKNNKNK